MATAEETLLRSLLGVPVKGTIGDLRKAWFKNAATIIGGGSKAPTKKAAFRFGGTHATSNMSGTQTQMRQRTPAFSLTVNATRMRVHFRNYMGLQDNLSDTTASPVPTGILPLRMYMGAQAVTGQSEYVAKTDLVLVPGAATKVNGLTEWTSDWFAPAAVGITDTRQGMILQQDLNWTAAEYIGTTSSTPCAMIDTTATGAGVVAPTVADPGGIGGGASTTAWYTYNYMLGDTWIEYEYADYTPNVLFVGHSYVDGAQFNAQAGNYGQMTGFVQRAAKKRGLAATVNAYSTSKMTDWTGTSTKWSLFTPAQGYNFDAIVVMLGGNDIVNDTTTQTPAVLLTRFQAIVTKLQAQYPGVPIYAINATPFGAVGDTVYGSGGKAVTAGIITAVDGFNTGLWTTIRGLSGVMDFERAFRDPANLRRPAADLLGPDNIHPNPRGYDKLADHNNLF